MQREGNGPVRRCRAERGIYYRETPTGRRYEIGYVDSSGRQRWQRTPGGIKEARSARAEIVAKLGRGERVAPSRKTLSEITDECLDNLSNVRPRTIEIYRCNLEQRVLPRLGRRKVAAIDEADVLDLIAAMQRSNCAPWTIHGTLTALSRVLSYATRRGMVASNVVRRLERGERPAPITKSERRILTTEEIGRLIKSATPLYRPIIATAVFSGARLGELLGLTWADVDFEGGFLRIRKQLDRAGERVTPKTAGSVREIVLLPALGRLLREHKVRSPYSNHTDFVFTSATGGPLHWRNVSKRGLEAAADRAKLHGDGKTKLTMHALRNTFASHLILDLKLDVVQVSKQLGHARPSITSDIYARLFDQARHSDDIRERMAASEFGRILEGGSA